MPINKLVPLSVHLMQETAKLQKQCNYVIKEMRVLRQEQTKLSELIPLSAAGSGMVIGTRQLDNLRSHLETCIHDSFRNASITGNNNDEVEFSNTSNKFDLFT